MKSSPILVVLAALPMTACLCFSHGMRDMGVTSETHRAHVGGMVFASSIIEAGHEQPDSFIDHCVIGKPCYGRFYLEKSLRESANDTYASAFALRATVDGKVVSERLFGMTPWWSTYNFTLFRAPNDDIAWEHPVWFLSEVANRLPPGDHALELSVLAVPRGGREGAGDPIASGRLTLTVPPNSHQIVAMALRKERQILAQAQAEAARQQAEQAAQSESQPAETSSSSESSSSESESSESSSSEAAPQPEEKKASCLPDGAPTDDWNKCCGGHWRGTAGSQTCCSEVGGGTDVNTACY